MSTRAAQTQASYRLRLDWGYSGAEAILPGADALILVDLLSFSTTTCMAAERGIAVLPFPLTDDPEGVQAARDYAAEHDSVLASTRYQATTAGPKAHSLSPAQMAGAERVPRVTVRSANGAAIAHSLLDREIPMAVGCLRNRHAVARWAQDTAGREGTIAVLAAGATWPDGSLRVTGEDLIGAGAIAAACADLGVKQISTEALLAAETFHAVERRLGDFLRGCATGTDLVEKGYAEDVRLAGQLDASSVVPDLDGVAFTHW